MKNAAIIFLFWSFGVMAQKHFIGPKVGYTSTIGSGNFQGVHLGEIGVSYSYKPKNWLSVYADATLRPSAYRVSKGYAGVNAYVSVPVYASFNLGRNKAIVAFDGGVINNYAVYGQDKYLGEFIGGLRAGRRGEKCSIEGYWHIGESFTKTYIQTNFVGIQVMFKL